MTHERYFTTLYPLPLEEENVRHGLFERERVQQMKCPTAIPPVT